SRSRCRARRRLRARRTPRASARGASGCRERRLGGRAGGAATRPRPCRSRRRPARCGRSARRRPSSRAGTERSSPARLGGGPRGVNRIWGPVQCSRVLRTRCALPMPPDPVGQDERFRARPPRSRRLRARHGACFSPRMNHALVFEALAAAYPDRECIVTPTRRLSYAQVVHGSGERLPPGALDYAAALAAATPAGPPVRPTPDDLYIIYTGGTTGAPKGVLWRQEDIFHAAMSGGAPGFDGPATIEDLVAEAEHGTYMRTLPVPPLMHGAAQWVAFGAIHKGGTVVLQGNPEKLDPEDVWGTAERERVSTIAIVGDAFARPLLDGLDQRQYDLSRLFIVGSGGAILSPHNKQAFLERLPHVTVVD